MKTATSAERRQRLMVINSYTTQQYNMVKFFNRHYNKMCIECAVHAHYTYTISAIRYHPMTDCLIPNEKLASWTLWGADSLLLSAVPVRSGIACAG